MRLANVALALSAALVGAVVFSRLGVPAGALVGATVAVTGIAIAGLSPSVPQALRNVAFTTIGATLGAGVTPHFLSDIMRFPASLMALTLTLAAVMVASNWLLRRLFAIDRTTATLATAPGAMSYSLALATSGKGNNQPDVSVVMGLQSLRLLLITLILPPLVAIIDSAAGTAGLAPHIAPALAIMPSVLLIALCAAAGLGLERLKVPAAFLLAGVIISGIGHGLGIVEGRPSNTLTFFGFALAGAVIGARFARISRADLRRLIGAGLATGLIAIGGSGLVSLAVATWLELPFGQVWVSFAPGGVEGMSAMALTLGYDPVYVATHHIFRLVLLLAFLPFLVGRSRAADARDVPHST